MTSSLLVMALVVGLFAGASMARATGALAGLRNRKSDVGKAKDAVRKARSAWWRTLGVAVALGIIAILYVLAMTTVDPTWSEQ